MSQFSTKSYIYISESGIKHHKPKPNHIYKYINKLYYYYDGMFYIII